MKAAVIGGGVIGGGWAARFALNGWQVSIYDPDPRATEKLDQVMANARRALPQLADVPMPEEGEVRLVATLAEAVAGAQWVQESVPERLDIKHQVMAKVQQHAPSDAIIASSTSGFKPSQLQVGCEQPDRVIVAHPFNPVYLLPLVELVSTPACDSAVMARAEQLLQALGMAPLRINKEIDAHVADRLLEAVWREALWLINDDIATTTQVDDAIRFGFGLRWAQMGLFETYRLAGGEEGMAHFIRQFGPALQWPWTKLTDVPELTEELVEKIASQSDAQSGAYSIGELERIRDDNLVGFLRVLKDRRWGIGEHLTAHDQRLAARLDPQAPHGEVRADERAHPIHTLSCRVLPAWIDYNGHMTEFRYLQVFAEASDVLLLRIGMDPAYIETGCSYYTVETHIMHIDENAVGAQMYVLTQVLHADEKRLHVFHQLLAREDDRLLATGEHMFLHVDRNQGKSCPAGEGIMQHLRPLAGAHAGLSKPELAGRYVGQRKAKK